MKATRALIATGIVLVSASAMALAAPQSPQQTLPPRPSAEELSKVIGQHQQQSFSWLEDEHPQLVLPSAEFVAFLSGDEWVEATEQCFAEFGMEATARWEGGIEWNGAGNAASGSAEFLEGLAAMYVCSVRYPDRWAVESAMSEAERGFLYDYARNVLVPCIRSAGYEVPPLPQREDYITQRAWWWGYERAQPWPQNTSTQLEFELLLSRCPEVPKGWYER